MVLMAIGMLRRYNGWRWDRARRRETRDGLGNEFGDHHIAGHHVVPGQKTSECSCGQVWLHDAQFDLEKLRDDLRKHD